MKDAAQELTELTGWQDVPTESSCVEVEDRPPAPRVP